MLVSCKLSSNKLPPTEAKICSALPDAPLSVVSPPDCRASTLPAVTKLLAQLWSRPFSLPRETDAPNSNVNPLEVPVLYPIPILNPLLLLSVFCSKTFLAACSRISPSAFSTALLPADRLEPETVMSDALPAPLATIVRSLPAATLEPTEVEELRSVVLLLLLLPKLILILPPPALSIAVAFSIAPAAFTAS